MGIFKVIRHTNYHGNYLYEAVKYVLHGEAMIGYKGSPNMDVYHAYNQMMAVKHYFGKTSGNPLFHFVISYHSRNVYDVEWVIQKTAWIADYFRERYQVIWCVHQKGEKKNGKRLPSLFHAHIVINSVSYVDGKMFSGTKSEIYAFLEHIKSCTKDSSWIIEYADKDVWVENEIE